MNMQDVWEIIILISGNVFFFGLILYAIGLIGTPAGGDRRRTGNGIRIGM